MKRKILLSCSVAASFCLGEVFAASSYTVHFANTLDYDVQVATAHSPCFAHKGRFNFTLKAKSNVNKSLQRKASGECFGFGHKHATMHLSFRHNRKKIAYVPITAGSGQEEVFFATPPYTDHNISLGASTRHKNVYLTLNPKAHL
jgi:hypothetical protein